MVVDQLVSCLWPTPHNSKTTPHSSQTASEAYNLLLRVLPSNVSYFDAFFAAFARYIRDREIVLREIVDVLEHRRFDWVPPAEEQDFWDTHVAVRGYLVELLAEEAVGECMSGWTGFYLAAGTWSTT